MTTIIDIRDRLALIQAGIQGVQRAYSKAPNALPASDLPAFVTFVGPSRPIDMGEQLDMEWRTFLMRLYVAPVKNSIPGEGESECYTLMDLVRTCFLGRPGLGLDVQGEQPLAEILDTQWMGDGGIVIRPYAGQDYLCAEFRLDVQRLMEVSYAEYE